MKAVVLGGVMAMAAQTAAACAWTAGWEEWAPYQYEENGVATGLDIDLLNAIATEAGCAISFSALPWKRHLEKMANGEIGLAAGASRTPEREAFARFSAAYRGEGVALLTAKDAPYDNLAGLLEAGGRLGVVREYAYGDDAVALMEDARFKSRVSASDSDRTNYRKLIAGRLDGVLLDPYSAGALKAEFGGEVEIAATVSESPIYVMFSKTATTADDVAKFDAALAALRADGRYDAIVDRYIGGS